MSARRLCALLAALPVMCANAAPPAFDSGTTGHLQHILSEAATEAYHGRYTNALAKDEVALAAAPNSGIAHLLRAFHYMDMGRYADAQADLDIVGAMHPESTSVPLQRASIALYQGDGITAMRWLNYAASLPSGPTWNALSRQYFSSWNASNYFMTRSVADLLLHQDDTAVMDMQNMLRDEVDDPWYILTAHCYHAALAGRTDMAEITCQEAIDQHSHDVGQYGAMGFTHLRMKSWETAIADYTKALYFIPDSTTSLYGRGIARRARGDAAGANADFAAATMGEPDIANIMKRLGAPVL